MTEEDFADWRSQEVTKSFLEWIKSTVEDCEKSWGAAINGGVRDEDLPMLRARLSERARLAAEIASVSYEDLSDDDEHERSDPDRVQGSNQA